MKKSLYFALAMIVMTSFIQAPVTAEETKNPYMKPDESWISISGTAVSVNGEEFTLDYGEDVITVEMDDWDWYDRNWKLVEGDRVTVYGRIDDDLFEGKEIEADSIYVENLGTYFYARSPEVVYDGVYDYWIVSEPIIVGDTVVRGTVTGVKGREFTVDTGVRKLSVETIEMNYNPLDDKGFQRIEKGDYVSIRGNMEKDFWDERELVAESIITLIDD